MRLYFRVRENVWVCLYFRLLTTMAIVLGTIGCGPKISSPEQMRTFEQAGPVVKKFGGETKRTDAHTGPYRVGPGDLLEFELPPILRTVSPEMPDGLQKIEPYLTRVNYSGMINLPIVGEFFVANSELPDIEAMVAKAYYSELIVSGR